MIAITRTETKVLLYGRGRGRGFGQVLRVLRSCKLDEKFDDGNSWPIHNGTMADQSALAVLVEQKRVCLFFLFVFGVRPNLKNLPASQERDVFNAIQTRKTT